MTYNHHAANAQRMIQRRHLEASRTPAQNLAWAKAEKKRKNSDILRQDIVLMEPHSPETIRKAGIAVCDRAESREEAELFLRMLGIIE